MGLVTRSRFELTVGQIYAIAQLEYDPDINISKSIPGGREIEFEFTQSEKGGRHIYVKDQGIASGSGFYHIARNGNTTWCGR
jgi:hypothetical protein